jgi:hypothetical protein
MFIADKPLEALPLKEGKAIDMKIQCIKPGAWGSVKLRFCDLFIKHASVIEWANDNLAALPVLFGAITTSSITIVGMGTCWEKDVRHFLKESIREQLRAGLAKGINIEQLKEQAKQIALSGGRLREFEQRNGTWDRIIDEELTSLVQSAKTETDKQSRAIAEKKLAAAVEEAVQKVEQQLPVQEIVDQAVAELTQLVNRITIHIVEAVRDDDGFETSLVDSHKLSHALIDLFLAEIRLNKEKINPGGLALVLAEQLTKEEIFATEDQRHLVKLLQESQTTGHLSAWWQKYQEQINRFSGQETGTKTVNAGEQIIQSGKVRAKTRENR